MVDSYLAVIDIGKTHKKVLIFDQNLNIKDSSFKIFEEYQKEGIIYEDLESMTLWITAQIRDYAQKYTIKALSVTTHGAMAVAIDQNGNPAIPPVAYTTDAGDQFREDFYQTFGSPEDLKRETCTTEIGSMVNIAKLIYFMQKKWPEKWQQVWKILNLPQYFGYLFTGKIGAEPTYVGCHTYLYNPEKRTYSSVAEKLGLRDLLPDKISNSWDVLGTISPEFHKETSLPKDCIVTMGIHDSNASLLPYLVKGFNNFILNSTGTWCVAMHPTESTGFKKEELDAFVFYNLNVYQEPVKTAIFKGGIEFEVYHKILKDINGDQDGPLYDYDLHSKIIKEKKLFILPTVEKGLGIFPQAQPKIIQDGVETSFKDLQSGKKIPEFFKDFETAMAVLNISLAIQSFCAMKMAGFDGKGKLFVEGGFRKNEAYLNILGALFPDAQIALTKMDEATAFGAAILATAALKGVAPEETSNIFDLDIRNIKTQTIPFMQEYKAEFDRLVKMNS